MDPIALGTLISAAASALFALAGAFAACAAWVRAHTNTQEIRENTTITLRGANQTLAATAGVHACAEAAKDVAYEAKILAAQHMAAIEGLLTTLLMEFRRSQPPPPPDHNGG